MSTFTPTLAVTPFAKPYRDVLGAHGFHCFRAYSSLHVSFISRVLLVLPTSLYYSLNLNCTPVNVCWLRFTRKHADIPSKQTSLWTSFIPLSLVSPHRLLVLLPSSPFLSFHQESYVRQMVPSQCLAQPMAMPLAVSRSWGEQAVSIMGQTSRCCMLCLMPQSHVSCSLENRHFNILLTGQPVYATG